MKLAVRILVGVILLAAIGYGVLAYMNRPISEIVAKPGEQFHDSNTGYILLGLILEAIEGKPYADILE